MRVDRTALLAAVLAAGCARPPAAPPVAVPPTGPAVVVVKPERRAIHRVIEQPGSIEAFEETDLFAKLPGFVRTIADDPDKKDRPAHDRRVDIGSRVKAGQVLAEVAIPEVVEEARQKDALAVQAAAETEQARKALTAAEASVAAAQAQVAEAKAGLARAQALYDRWQSEFQRVAGLVQGGVIDAQTRDETQNQFRAAEASRAEAVAKVATADAGVRKAQADRDKAAADVTAAVARQDVAHAEVRRLAALLAYTKITAPFDGVITRRAIDMGDFLRGDAATRGMYTVARLDPVRVVVRVPEADSGLVHEGSPVKIALPALGGTDRPGTVARTSWSLEPGSRTLRAEIDVPNPEGRLRPGMYAYAKVSADLPEAWALPAAAIGKAGDDTVIYRAEGGKAVRTLVRVIRGDGQYSQVRAYQRPGAADWVEFTGTEAVATPAAALTDGQPLSTEGSPTDPR